MKKIICASILLLCVLSLLCLTACSRFNENWIIGKTSTEIEEKYGAFDAADPDKKNEEGNYVSARCGYLTREKQVGFLGTYPEEYFMIYFDKEGKAYDITHPWYVPGG